MKTIIRNTFPHAHRAVLASAVVVLASAATAAAQTSGASGSSYSSGKKNPPADSSAGAASTSGAYHSTDANADVKATKDINAWNGSTSATAGHDKLSWGDKRFVTKAADEGMDEVALAKLAAERASNAEVRTFAQKLASDHEAVNSELTQMAGQKNVKIDQDDDRDRTYKRLNKKSGADFDNEFVEHMIDEHEKDIKMFEKASKDAKDPDVRSFAAKHVDHLRAHLQQAQSLKQTLMPTGRMDDRSGRSTPGGTPSATGTDTTSGSSSSTNTRSYDSSTSTPSTSTHPDTTSSSTTTKPDGSR